MSMNRDEPEIDEFDDLIESVEEEVGKLASDTEDTRREIFDFYETKIEEWMESAHFKLFDPFSYTLLFFL